MFGQTFDPHDLLVVGFLIVLEGVLSVDNALVLGLLAKRLPKRVQKRALTYGLFGAFAFRIAAVASASYLLRWSFVKLLGGLYLCWIAVKSFIFGEGNEPEETDSKTDTANESFWPTVVLIELTDLAFAVDSIVAAIGVVGPPPEGATRHPKLWVVIIGGMVGVILMRVAAVLFIKLLERFPRFEAAAYLLVLVIGAKLIADWGWNLDFEHPTSLAFWVFWIAMIGSFCYGFVPAKKPIAIN